MTGRLYSAVLFGLLVTFQATSGHASSRPARVDNPTTDRPYCAILDWSPLPNGDPYLAQDDNPAGPTTGDGGFGFFVPATAVAGDDLYYCGPVPTLADAWAADPNQPQNLASYSATSPMVATSGALYVWVAQGQENADAEVIVWTLPASTHMPSGGYEIELDGWCATNASGTPLGTNYQFPHFTWNLNYYVFNGGAPNYPACGAFGVNSDDLLLDSSGVLIGYVQSDGTAVFTPTVTGWAANYQPQVSLIGTPNSVTYGSSLSLQASVTGVSGISAPTGTVQFYLCGQTAGTTCNLSLTGTLNAQDIATVNLSAPAVGVYSVSPYYVGDFNYNSTYGNSQTVTVLPAAPSNASAASSTSSIILNWAASTGATSYSIYEGTTAGGEQATPAVSGLTSTTYTVPQLTPGQTYYFYVVAVSGVGNSAASNETSATVLPAVPSGLTAKSGNSSVTLSWSSSTGAVTYNIYQGTSAGTESNVPAATLINGTTTNISGLANGQTYYFKVAAVDAGGTSALSAEASATPAAPPSGGGGELSLLDLTVIGCLLCFQRRHRGPTRRPPTFSGGRH